MSLLVRSALVVAFLALTWPASADPPSADVERLWPTVVLDETTGLYHAPNCSRLGLHVTALSVKDAAERGKACPACCPLCGLVDQARDAGAAQATAAMPVRPNTATVVESERTGLYHLPGCPMIVGDVQVTNLFLATQKGLKPCSMCKPGLPPKSAVDDYKALLEKKGPPAGTAAPAEAAETNAGTDTVYVKGYYRKDGTYVKPHTRKKPKK